jgi:hypothetical protein
LIDRQGFSNYEKRSASHSCHQGTRMNLGQVVRRVHVNREYLILEKDGIAVVAIMQVDDLEHYLDQQDEGLQEQIKTGYQDYLAGSTREVGEFLTELHGPAKKAKKQAVRQLDSARHDSRSRAG